MGRRKPRLVLSCTTCRRRKVRCDRAAPCLRCQKAGYPETCTYDQVHESCVSLGAVEEDIHDAEEPNLGQIRHTSQEAVVETSSYAKSAGALPFSSERYLGLAHPAGPGVSTQSSDNSLQDSFKQTFNTQYFGPSHTAGLLMQCEELSAFVHKVLERVPISNRRREQTRNSLEKEVEKRARLGEHLSKEKLISLMPPRSRADSLIHTYLNMFENTYRVLHFPTFLKRYEEFWTLPNMTTDRTILQILLAMATVNAFVPGDMDSSAGCSSTEREQAKSWIRAAESWLSVQSQKDYTLNMLQIHVLLFHAKKMNCVGRKRSWTSIGILVRVAMAGALHREPTHLSQDISFFEAEMRRRLWYTVLGLELQEACDRGMQPMLNAEAWDCVPPLNIHDEDFDEMTIPAPCQKPLDVYTRTSFLCIGQKHYLLRLDILKRTNSVKNPMGLDTAKNYIDELQGTIDELPSWPEEPTSTISRTLSKLILYEQILVLQQPFTTQTTTQRRLFNFRTIQRQTAIFIMQSYRSLPSLKALPLFSIRGDGFRAVLTMCHTAIRSPGPMDDLLHNREAELELIEHMVTLLDARVRCLRQGFQIYWLASAAWSLVKARYCKKLGEEMLVVETAESASRLLDYINRRRDPDARGRLGDVGSRSADVGEVQEQVLVSSQNIDAFNNLADFGPADDWLLGWDFGDIWNLGALPGQVQM